MMRGEKVESPSLEAENLLNVADIQKGVEKLDAGPRVKLVWRKMAEGQHVDETSPLGQEAGSRGEKASDNVESVSY